MKNSIAEIKNKLSSLEGKAKSEYIIELKDDNREGVKKIIQSYENALIKRAKEIERIKTLIDFDYNCITSGQIVAGVDEVGRGPLAGPVVAACVVMDKNTIIEGVNDSKKLSKEKREELYGKIVKASLNCSIGLVDNEIIDEINILNATFLAMKSAIDFVEKELSEKNQKIDLVLVDGNQNIKDIEQKQKTVVQGDSKSYAIACASIVAKVYRDRLMEDYDVKYPGYDFASNKGYGTANHYQGLNNKGFCEIHRRSFCKNLDIE